MLTITLPYPASSLMPNRRLGKAWQASKDAKAKSFDDAYVLAFQAVNKHRGDWYPLTGDVPVTLTFCPPDGVRARADLDGLLSSQKHALDAIATALTINDRSFHPVTLKRGEKVKNGAVIVQIGA